MDNEIMKEIQEIRERTIRIETKIDGYNNLREKLDKTYNIAMNNREDIVEMKDNVRWLWCIVAGAIIKFRGDTIWRL